MKTVFIYALNCPITGRTRYIGKTKDLSTRIRKHFDNTHLKKHTNHRVSWIKSLLSRGLCPVLEVLDEVPNTEWVFWEREYIRLFRALGFDLVNGTEGGDGLQNPTPVARANMRAAHLGKKASDETRAKMSIAKLGKIRSPEHCANISKAKKGQGVGIKFSLERAAKSAAAHLGLRRSPGQCKNMKKAQELRRAKERQCAPVA